jgi:hypothetical protein
LGLTLQIVNHTGDVPIPLADVVTNQQQLVSSASGLLGLSILMVVFSSIGLFMACQKRKQVLDEYEMKRIEQLVAIHSPAPSRPVDLDDNSQEE